MKLFRGGTEMANIFRASDKHQEKNDTQVWDINKPAFPMFDKTTVGSNTRVLVLVPHEDDEIIGCGGTLCKFGKSGAHVKVVYLTGYGHGGSSEYEEGLVKIDKEEADVSLRALRCFESEMIHQGVKGVRCDRTSFERVDMIMNQYEPDILFVPCFDESRPNYLKTATIAAHALQNYANDVDCYCYSFGGVNRPNTLVDITDVIEDKIEAIREHRSQHRSIDEGGWIREMHQYRLSSTQDKDRYCECFHRFPKAYYLELARDLGLLEQTYQTQA
jgi:LmbE family N-acetylglucosaminyl deacetylase